MTGQHRRAGMQYTGIGQATCTVCLVTAAAGTDGNGRAVSVWHFGHYGSF